MLSKKENMLATISGDNPDRFVQQFEALSLFPMDPLMDPYPACGAGPVTNSWGITLEWVPGQPGPFPIQDDAHLVCKDLENWRQYVHAPDISKFTRKDWQFVIDLTSKVDRSDQMITPMFHPGIFERLNYLAGMQSVFIAFYECPDEMHELIEYIADFQLAIAEQWCEYVQPDAIFHHDDWGSQLSTFLAPDMFEDFFLEPWKRVYRFWRENTKEHLVVHHSDTFAQTLVPDMIDMGINVWQGPQTTNDIPKIIDEYGPQLTLMGGLNSCDIDKENWTPEGIYAQVSHACEVYGSKKKYFIPCLTQGGPASTFPGIYDAVNESIQKMSAQMF